MLKSLDLSTGFAFLSLAGVTFLCLIYSLINRNKGGEISKKEILKERRWKKEEAGIRN